MNTSTKHKRLLFQLNHPAHFHLFKNTINILETNGHEVLISIKDKDILKELVAGRSYVQLSEGYRKNNPISIMQSLVYRTKKLYKVVRNSRPDLMIGTSPEIGYISFITKIKSLFLGEDDVNLSPAMIMGALTCYPHFNAILSPYGVTNGVWNKKTIFYNGFQKLAYLHPNHFIPDRTKVNLPEKIPFFILRFASLQAYHDTNAKGISDQLAREIVKMLSSRGTVVVSSERQLPEDLERFTFTGNKKDIHHYLYYANLLVCDSQSMAVEAAMLGTPNIRYSNFVGKISVLEELEHTYKLTKGIKASRPEELLSTIKQFTDDSETIKAFKIRRQKLLDEKIDVTAFMVWFIENYPESAKIMRENPDYQYRFK